MKNQLQTKIKALGIYQIVGGLVGIGLTLYLFFQQPVSPLLLFIFISSLGYTVIPFIAE